MEELQTQKINMQKHDIAMKNYEICMKEYWDDKGSNLIYILNFVKVLKRDMVYSRCLLGDLYKVYYFCISFM